MFKLLLSFLNDERDDDAGDKSKGDCNDECKVEGQTGLGPLFEHFIDGERLSGCLKFEVRIASCCFQN